MFYGTLRFIAVFNRSPPPVPILSQLNTVHTVLRQVFRTVLVALLKDVESQEVSDHWYGRQYHCAGHLCVTAVWKTVCRLVAETILHVGLDKPCQLPQHKLISVARCLSAHIDCLTLHCAHPVTPKCTVNKIMKRFNGVFFYGFYGLERSKLVFCFNLCICVTFCFSFLCMGVKLGHSHSRKNKDGRWVTVGCWGRYLDMRGRKWWDTGENYIMTGFMLCTPH
jgi:hypothetical protein